VTHMLIQDVIKGPLVQHITSAHLTPTLFHIHASLLTISTMKFFAPLLALAAVAVAVPTGGTGPTTGTQQCCQNVTNSSKLDSVTKGLIKALLGVDVSNLNIPIGTGCTPIAILGGVQWSVQLSY
jgi:hypothetical protein